METQGTIGIKATLDITEMQRNAQRYLRDIDAMQNHTDVASRSVASSFSRIQAAGAAYLSVDMAKRFATEMVSVYGTFQQLDISFRTMLQSGDKATKLMGELVNFAAITPFNLIDVGKGAKQLLAYGTKVEDIKTDLEMLGNVASGVSVPLGDLIYLYGTLRSQGRAYTVDIRQFAGRGIPIYEELAKVLKVNVDEVSELVEAGRVGFPQVEKAFQNMTNQGGMFFNLMQEQSKSVTGKISNLQDKIDVVFNELGQSNDEFINGAIDGASYLVEHYKEIGDALTALVAVYGVHKAAVMANAAYYGSMKRIENVTMINAEAQALKALETEELKSNLTKQGLTVGSLEYNKALKAEIQAEMERQVQLAQSTNIELTAAKEKLATAELTKSQALKNIQLKEAELASTVSLAQAERVAAIEKRIAVESEKQSNAALSISRLQEQKDSAIKQALHLKEIGASNEKISANNREIASISEKLSAARAEEIQHSRNIVALRAEAKAVDSNVTSKAVRKAQAELEIATENLNTASISKNTAARDVSSKSAIIDSAIRRANTLETGLNTAGEVANTAAKSLGTKMTNVLTAATARLNAVLANNIWTIVAIGIAAVAYGIYKLVTYQTDAEKAQEKLNQRVKEFNSETEAEQAEIDRLFGKLDAAKKGTKEYDDAKKAIIDKYGDYLKGLGDEIEQLNNVALAYEAVSAAAKQAALDRAIADSTSTAQKDWADKQTELMDDLEKAIRDSDKYKGKKGIDREVSAIMQMVKSDLKSGGKLSSDTQSIVNGLTKEYYVAAGRGPGQYIQGNDVQVYVSRMMKNNEILESTYKDIHEKLGNDTNQYINLTSQQISSNIANFEAALERVKKTGRNQMSQLSDGTMTDSMGEAEIMNHLRKLKDVQAQQKKSQEDKDKGAETVAQRKVRWTNELTEAEKKLADLKADNSTATDKEIKTQQELVDGLKKKLGVDDKSLSKGNKKQEEKNRIKVENAERQRQIDELNQQDKEKAAQAELELSQAVIDAKDEGYLKQQAQIEQNYKKAKAENIRRANEYVKDQQQAERLAWEKEHPNYKEKGEIFTPITKTKDDLSPEKKNTLESYDKQAFDKKNADEKNLAKSLLETYQYYTDERLAIEKKFNDDIEALRVQREKYAKEGDTEKVQQTDRSIAQATTKKGESLVNFDYEQLKKSPDYVRAFENLKQTSSETLNSLLKQLEDAKSSAAQVLSPDQLREYTSTIQSIMDELAERNPFQILADRKKELAEAEEELAAAKKQLDDVKAAGGKKVISSSYNKDSGKIEATYLTTAEAMTKYNKAQDKVIKKTSQVREAETKVTESFSKLFNEIENVGGSIGGLTGEIIGMIGSIGSTVMASIEGLSAASKASSAAIQTVEKASVILAIISAAIQLATKVVSFFAADYSEYNKAKEAYENYVQVLDTVIEKQKELVKTLTGENAKNAYNYALELIGIQDASARSLGKDRLNAGASAGSHSIGVRIRKGMSDEGWNQAKQALGNDFYSHGVGDGRMEGLFDLSVEQLTKLRDEAPIFWTKLDGDVQDYLNSIVEGGEKVKEMEEMWKETLTSVSFDSVYESFLDMLYDMDADSQDFAKSFADYMRKAMIKSMFDKNYKTKLEEWYDLWAKYMEDGVIDEAEQNSLDNLKNSIITGAKAGADLINDQFKDIYQEEANREAQEKGIATASQDSIDEFNGRIMATNMMLSDILKMAAAQYPVVVNISSNIDNIKVSMSAISVNMAELKDLSKASNIHLANIETNTSFLSDIKKDMVEVKRGIEQINDKGIKLLR